ncbi:MAG: lysophospholipid acyltransferase family protein [Ferrimicrobium sp.]
MGGAHTYRVALAMCAVFTRLALLVIAKVKIDDVEIKSVAGRGAVIASNHRSLLDFFVGTVAFRKWGVYPHAFARGDFFAWPILGRALRLIGAIPAGHGRSATVTLKRAREILHGGGVITIAPEGRVVPLEQRPSGLGEMKGGIGIMSSLYATPILLAAIENTDKAWPLGRRTPVLHLPWNRPTITVTTTWLKVQAGMTPPDITTQVAQGLKTLLGIAERPQGDP